MRTALAVAAILFAIGAVTVLTLAGRTVCECPQTPVPETETTPAPAAIT
jgi:hypothetical protein